MRDRENEVRDREVESERKRKVGVRKEKKTEGSFTRKKFD